MRLLLDTHALLWWLTEAPQLSESQYNAIRNPANHIYVSAATTWEIGIKTGLGKITAPDNLATVIIENRFTPLPITIPHTVRISSLPLIHKDPFDRILIAQALVEDLIMVTADPDIRKYDVHVL